MLFAVDGCAALCSTEHRDRFNITEWPNVLLFILYCFRTRKIRNESTGTVHHIQLNESIRFHQFELIIAKFTLYSLRSLRFY